MTGPDQRPDRLEAPPRASLDLARWLVDTAAGLFLAGLWLAMRPLPRSWLLGLARALAPAVVRVCRLRVARKNLRIIRSVYPAAWRGLPEDCLLVEAVRHQLCTIVDLFKLVASSGPETLAVTAIRGWERLEPLVRARSGVVLVAAHQGNWELMGAALAARGVPVHAFYFEQLAPALDRFLAWARARSGMRMLHQRRGLRECLRVLREGGTVGFVADQDGSRDGIWVDFLGRLATMPRGPYEFARHAGCPVVPVSCHRLEDDSYELLIEQPLSVPAAESVEEVCRQVVTLFEGGIAAAPEQWQLFYDRFWLRHRPRLAELGLLERAQRETERDDLLADLPEGVERSSGSSASGLHPSQPALLRLAYLFYSPVLLLAAVWIAFRGRTQCWLWKGEGPELAASLALAVAMALLTVFASRILSRRFTWGEQLELAFREILGPIDGSTAVRLAAISALAEEAFFRGALQPELGLFWASLLFGLVHFPAEPRLRPWTLFAFVVGLALGVLYDVTGGLLAPVLAHFSINAINLAWLGHLESESGQPDLDVVPAGTVSGGTGFSRLSTFSRPAPNHANVRSVKHE